MNYELRHLPSMVYLTLCIVFAMSLTNCSFLEKDEPDIPAEEIIITHNGSTFGTMSTRIDNLVQLDAIVFPENTTDKTIEWISLDRNIATVSENGIVRGISVGTATIYAVCGNVSAHCRIQFWAPNSGSDTDNNSEDSNSGNSESQLSTPTGVTVVNIGTETHPIVRISWNRVPNATIYRVIRTYPLDGGYETEGKYVKTGIVDDTSNEYLVDNNVNTGTRYCYKVMASAKGYQGSNWSAEVHIDL